MRIWRRPCGTMLDGMLPRFENLFKSSPFFCPVLGLEYALQGRV